MARNPRKDDFFDDDEIIVDDELDELKDDELEEDEYLDENDEYLKEDISEEELEEEDDDDNVITPGWSGSYKSLFEHKNKIDHKMTKKMYDQYKKGKVSEEEWITYNLEVMEFYIVKMVKPYIVNNHQEFEDLMSESYVAVMEKVRDYNPHQAKPTSYYTGYIHSALKRYLIDEAGTTHHYDTNFHLLEKRLRKEGYTGSDDPRLNFAKIVHLSGMPQKTVQEVLSRNNVNVCSLNKYSDNHDLPSPFLNPEDYVIREEEGQVAKKVIGVLTPLEKWILKHSHGIADISKELKRMSKSAGDDYDFCPYAERKGDHEYSAKQMAAMLKTDKAKKVFGDQIPKTINGLVVQQLLQGALTKLSINPQVNRYYQDKPRNTVIEQCTENDLQQAFDEGLLKNLA